MGMVPETPHHAGGMGESRVTREERYFFAKRTAKKRHARWVALYVALDGLFYQLPDETEFCRRYGRADGGIHRDSDQNRSRHHHHGAVYRLWRGADCQRNHERPFPPGAGDLRGVSSCDGVQYPDADCRRENGADDGNLGRERLCTGVLLAADGQTDVDLL